MGHLQLLVFRSQPCCSAPPEKGTQRLGLSPSSPQKLPQAGSWPRQVQEAADHGDRGSCCSRSPAQSTGGVRERGAVQSDGPGKGKGETFC